MEIVLLAMKKDPKVIVCLNDNIKIKLIKKDPMLLRYIKDKDCRNFIKESIKKENFYNKLNCSLTNNNKNKNKLKI